MRQQSRFKGWDGSVRLFKLRDHRIYRGLVPRIQEFAEQRNYTVENQLPEVFPFLDGICLDGWLSTMQNDGFLPLPLRDYQRAALRIALDTQRGVIVSPTGSGKSYIIWLLAWALSMGHTLIIVPTTGLVAQMQSDFISYGCDPHNIQVIQGGLQKAPYAQLVISTWQSIYDLPAEYFNQFGCVVCDEVHLAKAKSLSGLMEKCVNIAYRFGFTGTLMDTQAHRLILEGLFGTISNVTTTTELVKQHQLAPLRVKMVCLKYPEDTCKHMRHSEYTEEVDFIVGNQARNKFVAELVSKLKGNTLVLFTLIDKHGKALYEHIKTLCPNHAVHFVTGGVCADDREDVRQRVEAAEDKEQIIVASYGVFSTGINLRRLHNLVLASAGKSKIRTLQSIGRGLRTHATKNHIAIYDIVDDLRIGNHRNYAFKHAEERSALYAAEKFPVTLHTVSLDAYTRQHLPNVLSEPRCDDLSVPGSLDHSTFTPA